MQPVREWSNTPIDCPKANEMFQRLLLWFAERPDISLYKLDRTYGIPSRTFRAWRSGESTPNALSFVKLVRAARHLGCGLIERDEQFDYLLEWKQ